MNNNKTEYKTNNTLPRLDRVVIKNSSGRSFDIELNGNLNILTGANGSGKTSILNMIECVLNPGKNAIHFMLKSDFDSIYCIMSDGFAYGVEREFEQRASGKEFDSTSDYMAYLTDPRRLRWEYIIRDADGNEERLDLFKLHKLMPVDSISDIKRIIAEEFKYAEEDYVFWMIESIYDSYDPEYILGLQPYPIKDMKDDQLKYERNRKITEYLINYFMAKHGTVAPGSYITHITEDRIYRREVSAKEKFEHGEFYDDRCEEQIYILSFLIGKKYKDLGKNYKEKTERAKDSFAEMYLNREDAEYSEEELKIEWVKIKERYQELEEIGLISDIPAFFGNYEWPKAANRDARFIKVYMDAYKDALTEYDEDYKWFKLLSDIYAKRNASKGRKLKYDSQGIAIISDEKCNFPDELSPGEKSELIMYMNLIFKALEGGIVLIDEPEISLDEDGQKLFMENLTQIAKMRNLQVIMATKSSTIISGVDNPIKL